MLIPITPNSDDGDDDAKELEEKKSITANASTMNEVTSKRLLVKLMGGMCEERSDELTEFLEERRYMRGVNRRSDGIS